MKGDTLVERHKSVERSSPLQFDGYHMLPILRGENREEESTNKPKDDVADSSDGFNVSDPDPLTRFATSQSGRSLCRFLESEHYRRRRRWP